MKLHQTKTIYRGRCFKNPPSIGGAFMVHQIWERDFNQSKFVLIEDLQTNKLKTISIRTLYRRVYDDNELQGFSWFLCGKCRGSGKTKYGKDECTRCEGLARIWVDARGIDHNDLIIDKSKRENEGNLWQFLQNPARDVDNANCQ